MVLLAFADYLWDIYFQKIFMVTFEKNEIIF